MSFHISVFDKGYGEKFRLTVDLGQLEGPLLQALTSIDPELGSIIQERIDKFQIWKQKHENEEPIKTKAEILDEHKKNNQCVDCGRGYPMLSLSQLTYDHFEEKEIPVNRHKSLELIQQELLKTVIRCRPCHSKKNKRIDRACLFCSIEMIGLSGPTKLRELRNFVDDKRLTSLENPQEREFVRAVLAQYG